MFVSFILSMIDVSTLWLLMSIVMLISESLREPHEYASWEISTKDC